MNPIGRVFLVLNVVLAGAFVAFAGTYLERDDDWKTKYTKETNKLNLDLEQARQDLRAEITKTGEKENVMAALNQKLTIQTNQLKDAQDTNTRLQARLAQMEANVTEIRGFNSTIDTRLATAMKDANAAQQMAIAAEKAKDDAVAAKNESDAALAAANFKIKNMETDIAGKLAKIGTHEQTIREKNVLLDIVNRRYPGIFTTLHPLVTGTVSHVGASGNLVTIDLKSGAENLKAGHTFALFNATDGYKGEAVVNEINADKKYCFARISLDQGKKINAGDTASTDVSRSGN